MIALDAGPGNTLFIKEEANIHNAMDLHSQLAQLRIESGGALALNLLGVTALDTAGAQVLIAFKRANPSVTVHSCPDEIRRFAERTGLVFLLL